MKILSLIIVISLGMIMEDSFSQSFQYIMGTQKYNIPSISKPAKGAEFSDPDFNTSIVRLSDKSADGYSSSFMVTDYASYPLIAVDNRTAFLGTFRFSRYDIDTYDYLGPVEPDFLRTTEPTKDPEIRLDPEDPDLLYYVAGTAFYQYRISNGSSTLLHDFINEYPGSNDLLTDGQGEPSMDGRYWAFQIRSYDGRVVTDDIIVYDKDTDTIVSKVSDFHELMNVRWVSMSPSGDYVLVRHWGRNFLDEWGGTSFTRDFSQAVTIEGLYGHSDRAIDTNGNEVAFYINTQSDWVCIANLATGEVTNLFEVDYGTNIIPGFHFSGSNYDRPGWGLVSTYIPEGSSNEPTRHWSSDSIFMIELTANPRIWRIAHSYTYSSESGPQSSYWTSPKASINKAGTHILWTANSYDSADAVDVYMATLPKYWWENLNGVSTSVDEGLTPFQPESFRLYQNYPNPFNPQTRISYEIDSQATVAIKLFDQTGNEVITLVNEVKNPGSYQINWNGTNAAGQKVSSGVYFYKLLVVSVDDLSNQMTIAKKMTFLK